MLGLVRKFLSFGLQKGVECIAKYMMLPLGALCYVLFCVTKKGWGYQNFIAEANEGSGLKLQKWMRPYITYVLPLIIVLVFVVGILNFQFADNFTILGWIKSLF